MKLILKKIVKNKTLLTRLVEKITWTIQFNCFLFSQMHKIYTNFVFLVCTLVDLLKFMQNRIIRFRDPCILAFVLSHFGGSYLSWCSIRVANIWSCNQTTNRGCFWSHYLKRHAYNTNWKHMNVSHTRNFIVSMLDVGTPPQLPSLDHTKDQGTKNI